MAVSLHWDPGNFLMSLLTSQVKDLHSCLHICHLGSQKMGVQFLRSEICLNLVLSSNA